MFKQLLFPVLLLLSACIETQSDAVIFEDQLYQTKVLQSDLDGYLQLRKIKDTVGKTKQYLNIISAAKFIHTHRISSNGQRQEISYEEALANAEEISGSGTK
jgi:hypothetical protein